MPAGYAKNFPSNFPRLGANYLKKSSDTDQYNCIAWAMSECHRPWWPGSEPAGYWPPDLPHDETIDNFVEAFRRKGYELCAGAHHEWLFEKVAIYADLKGVPTHAARQPWRAFLDFHHPLNFPLAWFANNWYASFVMTDPSPKELRLDTAPSRAFSWLSWQEVSQPITDERGRTVRPAGSVLTVRYRTTGLEMEFWPISIDEAQQLFNPGARYGYSIGSAFAQIARAVGKSSRTIKSGERQATKAQREQQEKQSGRRWLA